MAGIHEREGFPSSGNLEAPFVEKYFEGLISLWPMGRDLSSSLEFCTATSTGPWAGRHLIKTSTSPYFKPEGQSLVFQNL